MPTPTTVQASSTRRQAVTGTPPDISRTRTPPHPSTPLLPTPHVTRPRHRTADPTRWARGEVEGLLRGYGTGLHGFNLALRSLDPYATLQRGYALVQRDGQVVESVADTTVGERLGVRVRGGDFPVQIGRAHV